MEIKGTHSYTQMQHERSTKKQKTKVELLNSNVHCQLSLCYFVAKIHLISCNCSSLVDLANTMDTSKSTFLWIHIYIATKLNMDCKAIEINNKSHIAKRARNLSKSNKNVQLQGKTIHIHNFPPLFMLKSWIQTSNNLTNTKWKIN